MSLDEQVHKDTMMLYIRLFHGRTDPNQDMDDSGQDGPIFGPFEFVHTLYGLCIKLGKTDGHCVELYGFEDMLYYDGVYYGEWTVCTKHYLNQYDIELTPFEPIKAQLPTS